MPTRIAHPWGVQMALETSGTPVAQATVERFLRRHWRWLVVCGLVAVGLRNFAALASVPRGFYQDEAAIGYDGWAIAHYGVDEHGAHLPLFFESFGDYKNPVYIYAVAAVTHFLPLTVASARLPAAVFGTLTVMLLTATAWKLTRSASHPALPAARARVAAPAPKIPRPYAPNFSGIGTASFTPTPSAGSSIRPRFLLPHSLITMSPA